MIRRWKVRWQGADPARYGCDWPYRQVGTAPLTERDVADGITEGEPLWEAEVTAPTEDAAMAAIWGCYWGEPRQDCEPGTWIAEPVK